MTCGDLEADELLETGLGFPAKDMVPATQSQDKWLMTKVQGNDGAHFNVHNSESAGLRLNLQPIEEGKKNPNGAVSSFHRVRTFQPH